MPTSSSGTSTGAITTATTYTLNCTGPGGSATRSVTVNVNSATGVTVTPRNAALTLTQTQLFSAAAPGSGAIAWKIDGIANGNATVGTIPAAGVYTPGTAGTHVLLATSVDDTSKSGTAAIAVTDLGGVYTYHNDLARTGQNIQEYALTPATVGAGPASFGRRWSCAVDGEIHAQPLYIAKGSLSGAQQNMLIVATQHDSVYAFDADNSGCVSLRQKSFLSTGVTTIPSTDIINPPCTDIRNEFGIAGTPVIDPASGTLYLVAATKESGSYVQRLHALYLSTGAERSGSPTTISATTSGTGTNSLFFDALQENQRAALALSSSGVFIGWASHCDNFPFVGWLMRYSASSLAQTAVFNVAPNVGTRGGGIWMSGGGPAADASGAVYISTGNGSFNLFASGTQTFPPFDDYSMSFLKFDPSSLTVQDFYTPSQETTWVPDLDISSAEVLVLQNGAGPSAHPNLLVGADKQAHLWLLDRSAMGNYNPTADNVLQYLSLPNSGGSPGVFSSPGYYNGTVYIGGVESPFLALPLNGGVFNTSAQTAIDASRSTESYPFPGSTPSISASPAGNAIVWVLDTSGYSSTPGPSSAILRAYDAVNLGTTLCSSAAVAGDAPGYAIKFSVPVVANGHVYVGGGDKITVCGLTR